MTCKQDSGRKKKWCLFDLQDPKRSVCKEMLLLLASFWDHCFHWLPCLVFFLLSFVLEFKTFRLTKRQVFNRVFVVWWALGFSSLKLEKIIVFQPVSWIDWDWMYGCLSTQKPKCTFQTEPYRLQLIFVKMMGCRKYEPI